MFKIGSFEDEIFRSMEKELVSSQVEQTYGFDKLDKAADYLSSAADIFEQAGLHKEADEILEVLQGFANKLNKTSSS